MEGRPLDETDLVERARRGDVDAYEALMRAHQAVAFRTAYLITAHEAEAEDAAQSAFVKAYYALGRFRRGSPFRPWLLAIVANEARNRRRALARQSAAAARMELSPVGDGARDDAASSPEASALARERQAILLRALNQLSESDRLAITFRYFLDLSEAEMAAALGCARGTVKSRLSRALARLREIVAMRANDLVEAETIYD